MSNNSRSFLQTFVELLLGKGVLRFGDFKTKAGRLSPYFMNMGNIASGKALLTLSELYMEKIQEEFPDTKKFYGPAYKGIPLVVALSQVMASRDKDVDFTFNRKEAKDHGEGGVFVGCDLGEGDRVVIVEDILTGGTSLRESLELLRSRGVHVDGAVVGIDREEKGKGELLASEEIFQKYDCPVYSLAKVSEIIDHLQSHEVLGKRWIDDEMAKKIEDYRQRYGV